MHEDLAKPAVAVEIETKQSSLLLSPTFWIIAGIWTAAVGYYCLDVGAENERFKQQEISVKALEAQAKDNERVLKAERQLRTDDRTEFITYKEKQANADKNDAQLIADLRSDNRRLRVPVRRAVCGAAPAAGGPAAAGTGDEGHAELSADAGVFLVDLLARGDSAIRKHATVVDRYERLREACTAPSTTPTGDTP